MVIRILKSHYFKSFFMLLSGSLLAQVISFIFTPMITRLFTPEQMGVFTLVLTVVSMFGAVICARYDMVIVSAEKTKDVYRLIVLSLMFTLFISIIITIGFIIYVKFTPELNDVINSWALILLPILIIQGITNILTSYNNRYKEYGLISRVNVIRVSVLGILQVIFGLLNLNTVSLLISYLISIAMGLKTQSKRLLENIHEFKDITWIQLKEVLVKYKDQPIYSVPAIFLNSASYAILPFIINALYGTAQVGYFSISFRLLGVPLTLISANISRIYFQRASEDYNNGKSFSKTFEKTTIFLSFVALPMTGLLYFFGEQIIVIVFGSNWAGAGVFIKGLSLMYGLRLIVTALSVTLTITNKQKYDFLLQSTFLIATIISYAIAKLMVLEINDFINLISILYSVNYLVYWFITYKLSKRM